MTPALDTILTGERVRLRPPAEDDLALLDSWYRPARGGMYGPLDTAIPGESSALVIDITGRQQTAGLIEYRMGEPARGWLTIVFMAIEPALRGWGYGSESVRLLEEAARQSGHASFCAPVTATSGLNVYFWLRLGYRLAHADDGLPPALGGALLMVRRDP